MNDAWEAVYDMYLYHMDNMTVAIGGQCKPVVIALLHPAKQRDPGILALR
jgi:hypothetical protein